MNIIEKIKKLNLTMGEYVIIGSGILDALGIRKANDIDISALPQLYSRLRATGEWNEEERYGKIFLKRNGIEINPQLSWSAYPTSTEEAISSAMIIDGIPFMNLKELRKFKKTLGRDKDFADIILIDEYLREHP